MIKKIAKIALLAAFSSGLGLSASAAETPISVMVNADIHAYTGMYDSGLDGQKGNLETVAEAHANFRALKGPFYMLYQIEAREEKDAPGKAIVDQEFNDSFIQIGYKSGAMTAAMGTVVHPTTSTFTFNQGLGTTQVPISSVGVLLYAGYAEEEGLQIKYAVSPQMNIAVTLYDKAAVSATGVAAGQTVQAGVYGKVAGFDYLAGYTNETADNHLDATPDKTTNTMWNASLRKSFGNFTAALDYAALKQEVTEDYSLDRSAISAQFAANEVGPGKLIFTLGLESSSGDDSLAAVDGINYKDDTVASLVYDIPVGNKTGFKVLYTSRATKWNSDETDLDSSLDDTTATYFGGGLYGRF